MPATYPYTSVGIEGTIMLFDGFGTISNYRGSLYEESAMELKDERLRLLLGKEIAFRFYQALAAKLLAEVSSQNIKTLQEHLKDAKTRERLGSGTSFEVLRIDVQIEEAISEQVASDNQIDITRAKLAQVMGQDTKTFIKDQRPLEGTLPDPDPTLLESVKTPSAVAVERGDLKSLRKIIQAQEEVIHSANSAWYPRLSLFINNQGYNNVDRSFHTDPYERAYAIGVNLTWSLLDGGESTARREQAIYKKTEQEKNLQIQLAQLPYDLSFWKKRYSLNLSQFHARKRAIVKAAESVRLAQIGIKSGVRTNSVILDAELDLFRARAGCVKAKLDAVEAGYNLQLIQ
jgi:outer membrane protein TolC